MTSTAMSLPALLWAIAQVVAAIVVMFATLRVFRISDDMRAIRLLLEREADARRRGENRAPRPS